MSRTSKYIPSFKTEKQNAIRIATELRYSKKTINKLKNAKTEPELSRILCDARQGKI